jgi:hypothetical protein
MESARTATLRLMLAHEKGILPTERSATVAAQTQQEPQTDFELKQSPLISFLKWSFTAKSLERFVKRHVQEGTRTERAPLFVFLTKVIQGTCGSGMGRGRFVECRKLAKKERKNMKFANVWMWGAVVGWLATAGAQALETVVDGITWGYALSGNTASITSAVPLEGTLVIPASVDGYPVTHIGDSAFRGSQGVTNVTMSDGVTSIGRYAFWYCTDLTSITLSSGINQIGDNAFYGCDHLEWVTIPQSVCSSRLASVFPTAFTNIVTVDFCNGVKRIGNRAFEGCSCLASLNLPESVNSIGDSALRNCGSLLSVTIPGSVTNIGSGAFYGCRSLTSLTIPDSVTSIGNYAFAGCTNLNLVSIPQYICDGHFFMVFSGYSPISQALPKLTTIEIHMGVTNIAPSTFSGCHSLTTMDIPVSVSSIGKQAFRWCYNLQAITIPKGVLNIEEETFLGCSNLVSVVIPDSVLSIGKSAFSECRSLENIFIPASVTNIGNLAFSYCGRMEGIQVDKNNQFFSSEDGVLFSKNMQNLLQYPGARKGAYVLPDAVTNIQYNAFLCSTGLTAVVIGNSVKTIGAAAFSECICLTNLSIGRSVERIDVRAFSDCHGLESLVIPSSVTRIAGGAFSGCKSMKGIYVDPDNQSYTSIDGVLFSKNKDTVVQYPGGKHGSYAIPAGVRVIGSYSFSECGGLSGVIIPDSVQLIWSCSFHFCTNLASVSIGNSVTNIGFEAFRGCAAMRTVHIGHNVSIIGIQAFRECSNLPTATIPDSVTNIGSSAFLKCNALQTLRVPLSWQDKVMTYTIVGPGEVTEETEHWSQYAGVPSECEIIYYDSEKKTTGTPAAVPYGWLESDAPEMLEKNSWDYEKTAVAAAANGRPVWECYLSGLSTTDTGAEFKVKSISVVDGKAVVEWAPDLDEDRAYKLLGKRTLSDEKWEEVSEGADVDTEGWRFFRVRVELP